MRQHLQFSSWLAAATLLLSATTEAVSLPSCEPYRAPHQKKLTSVRTSYVSVPLAPFGVVYATHQKDIAFVTLDHAKNQSSLGVLDTSTFTPSLIHQISLPQPYINQEGALGLTLTHNGKHILVAAGQGAIVLDAALAAAGSPDAVVGALNGTTGKQTPGPYAIEITVDGHYAFISQEYGSIAPNTTSQTLSTTGNIDVFRLHKAANGTFSGKAIGYISLGYAVVGTALSPDGRYLYAVSETTTANDTTAGFLSVLDVETLKHNPKKALISSVGAGCGPVRIIVSSDGAVVWVTARESNHLLAYDAATLVSDKPDKALVVSLQVGTSPVGLTFALNETRILTADSNRFNYTDTTTGLTVVDVKAALAGEKAKAVLGRVPTGMFPREFATSKDGCTILVADNLSGQVQAVDVTTLP